MMEFFEKTAVSVLIYDAVVIITLVLYIRYVTIPIVIDAVRVKLLQRKNAKARRNKNATRIRKPKS